ncbi:MAG: hypothetical protein PHW47_09245 [Lachnospira sp.]|nr:hypothetical protein [Lachnospira sp.]
MENQKEMPAGLAFQMAMNEQAMEHYARMTQEERKQVLERAKNVQSKEQMRGIVEELGRKTF